MSIESILITHGVVAAAASIGTIGFLRYISGWATSFENTVSSKIAVIEHVLGIGSVSQATAAPQAAPSHPATPATPIGTGSGPSPGAGASLAAAASVAPPSA